MAVYWWDFSHLAKLPANYHIEYWDGTAFQPVHNASGLGLENEKFNTTTFDEITTTRLRVVMDSSDRYSSTLAEWTVTESEHSKPIAPIVAAGADRDLMLDGKTYLDGHTRSVHPITRVEWTKIEGPGTLSMSSPASAQGTAMFSAPGVYELRFTAWQGDLHTSGEVRVKVVTPPPAKRLDVVYTKHYSIDSKLWNDRAKVIIVNS